LISKVPRKSDDTQKLSVRQESILNTLRGKEMKTKYKNNYQKNFDVDRAKREYNRGTKKARIQIEIKARSQKKRKTYIKPSNNEEHQKTKQDQQVKAANR